MESDFRKFAEGLAENAREGVTTEEKILEWKLAQRKLREANKDLSARAKAS